MNSFEHFYKLYFFWFIDEPLSHDYEQAITMDAGIFVNKKRTPRKRIAKERWEIIKIFPLIKPSEEQLYIAMNLCVPHYQVPLPKTTHYCHFYEVLISTLFTEVGRIFLNLGFTAFSQLFVRFISDTTVLYIYLLARQTFQCQRLKMNLFEHL